MCVRVLQIHIYVKLPVFIHLPLTLTKLCHFKCKHLVNFYISSEKKTTHKKIVISLQRYDIWMKFGILMLNGSFKCIGG